MKKLIYAFVAFIFTINFSKSQLLKVDTISFKGDVNKYINFVIMGDGYTLTEQDKFVSDARKLTDYLFTQSPWLNYKNYFNVFAIRVVSAQSGTKHPNTANDCSTDPVPVSNPNTYFGCSFDAYGIHRLVVAEKASNIANVLLNNFPNYDQAFIIANSIYYGGSGGDFATSTIQSNSNEISAHELGHSFAKLIDEYYAGDVYSQEGINMTKQTDPSLVKWKNWMGVDEIGIYQHCCGGQSNLWYRPHNDCKMRYLNRPYCNVCREGLIEKIHSLTNPIVRYSPTTLEVNSNNKILLFRLKEIMYPVPNTLNIKWELDGINILNNVDSVNIDPNNLSNSKHLLTATVTDTSDMIRINNHSTKHFNLVTWTIDKTSNTGVKLISEDNKLSFSLYPNPSSKILNINISTEKKLNASFKIVSIDGKVIQEISNEIIIDGNYTKDIIIGNLTSGTYILVANLNGVIYSHLFVKE